MPNTEEQRRDIIDNCNILLNGILAPFTPRVDTAEGRMINQLTWLKIQAENYALPLPVKTPHVSSLRYIYTNGDLRRHEKTKNNAWNEVEIYLDRLLALTSGGQLLFKANYYQHAARCIDILIWHLHHSPRVLSRHERATINELFSLRHDLTHHNITPPLGNHDDYPSFNLAKYSIINLPYCKELIKLIHNAVFNGIRPDTWLTPNDAEQSVIRLDTRKTITK